MEWFEQAWLWLGREIATFGLRWLVVALLMFGFGGWYGRRYRALKNEVAALHREIAELKAEQARGVRAVEITVNKPVQQPSQPEPVRTASVRTEDSSEAQ